MIKKMELTPEQMELENLVLEITDRTDPKEGQIQKADAEYKTTKQLYASVTSELQSLGTMDEPVAPTPHAARTAQYSFGITAAAVVVLFLLHCVVWVLKLIFPITWNTWGWTTTTFFWGIGISLVLTIIAVWQDSQNKKNYEQGVVDYQHYTERKTQLEAQIDAANKALKRQESNLDRLYRLRFDALGYALNNKVGMPFPSSAICLDNYKAIKKIYLEFSGLLKSIKATDDKALKTELRDKLRNSKLRFLYEHSLKAEVSSDVYQEFKRQYDRSRNAPMVMRQDIPAASSKGAKELMQLANFKGLLEDDHLSPIIDRFNAVANRNTNKSGFLSFMTDTDKKAQQTRDLQKLATAAKQEYDELMEINKHVSYALEFVRGCAYRNIYLGAEMINYIKDTAGGGSMEKAQDSTDMINLSQDTVNIEAFSIDANVSDAALNTIGMMANTVMDNKQLQQLVKNNPKMSAGIAAVAAIGSAAYSYMNNLANNAEAQHQLINTVNQISEGYTEGKAAMFRAIEIIGAIVEANKGFMAVYAPLSKRVYVDGEIVPAKLKTDLTLLAKATKEYKKIADSKIKK